jgi:nucleoside-diphosphate-sugar epimerase
MRLLITGGESHLAQTLAAAFAGRHDVRLAAGPTAGPGPERLAGDLRDPAFAAHALAGVDAVIHLAPLWPGLPADHTDQERLDHAARGTYVLLTEAARLGVRRVVLASTLDLFERCPASWRIDESWRTRPSTEVGQLAAHLAEASARECSRVEPLQTVCLRLGHLPDEPDASGEPFDPRWLRPSDAVQAIERALAFVPTTRYGSFSGPPANGWWVFHIPGGGARAGASGVAPSPGQATSRPIRKVVVFGAGGPLAAATIPLLTERYTLRITDLRPMEEVVAAGGRTAGAPLPRLLGPPHEMRQVDVTDPGQVLAACEGMDAIVNCTVVRPHPEQAFLVNCIGAYNVMRAAVAHGIRRVVHTGPQQVMLDRPGGYWWDSDVPADAPPRPGTHLYRHTKYLGQEICRVFAEVHGLEVPVLQFSVFVDPATAPPGPAEGDRGISPMTVSWPDAGQAMRRALEVPALPRPFEVFHIVADLPHGKYSNEKAVRLLGWRPRDTLEHLWTVPRPAQ